MRQPAGLVLLVAVLSALACAPSGAASFFYATAAGELLRDTDGRTLSARPLAAGAPTGDWRTIFVAGPGQTVAGLSCDRERASVCFVELTTAASDRLSWRPIKPAGGGTEWGALDGFAGTVAAVDDTAGLALLVTFAPRQPGAGDLAPGVYLWKRGESPSAARLFAPLNPSCMNAAQFVRASEPPLVLVSKGCDQLGQPGAWVVLDVGGRTIASIHAPGLPLGVVGGDLVFAGRVGPNAVDRTVYRMSIPTGPPGNWVGGTIYVPDEANGRPALVPTGRTPFPASAVDIGGGRMIAVWNDASGPSLFEFCDRKGGVVEAAATSAPAPAIAQLNIASQGGDAAIASALNAWGQRTQYLVAPKPAGAGATGTCADGFSITPLPAADPAPAPSAPLSVERRTVVADDGEALPYVVLGAPGGRGPLLGEVYGAAGQPTYAMLQVELERAWVRRGGRVAIATVRGDARDPPWRVNAGPDYQARAATDFTEIVQDLVARGDAAPGEVTALGASAGAFTAARAVLLRPDLFAAAVLAAGPFDLTLNPPVFGPATGGFPDWFEGSRPGGGCRAVRFFLYQGAADDRVSPQNSVLFAGYLHGLGYRGQLLIVPGGGHYLLEDPSSAPKILADLDAWTKERVACARSP